MLTIHITIPLSLTVTSVIKPVPSITSLSGKVARIKNQQLQLALPRQLINACLLIVVALLMVTYLRHYVCIQVALVGICLFYYISQVTLNFL